MHDTADGPFSTGRGRRLLASIEDVDVYSCPATRLQRVDAESSISGVSVAANLENSSATGWHTVQSLEPRSLGKYRRIIHGIEPSLAIRHRRAGSPLP